VGIFCKFQLLSMTAEDQGQFGTLPLGERKKVSSYAFKRQNTFFDGPRGVGEMLVGEISAGGNNPEALLGGGGSTPCIPWDLSEGTTDNGNRLLPARAWGQPEAILRLRGMMPLRNDSLWCFPPARDQALDGSFAD